jgi:hypothetical protein
MAVENNIRYACCLAEIFILYRTVAAIALAELKVGFTLVAFVIRPVNDHFKGNGIYPDGLKYGRDNGNWLKYCHCIDPRCRAPKAPSDVLKNT